MGRRAVDSQAAHALEARVKGSLAGLRAKTRGKTVANEKVRHA